MPRAAWTLVLLAGCGQLLGIEDPQAGSGSGSGTPRDASSHDANLGGDAAGTCAGTPLAFGSGTPYPAPGFGWFDVGDLNHDTKPDLVIAGGSGGAPIAIFHGPGQLGTPTTPALANSCTMATYVQAVDIDGDGYGDLVVGACGGVQVLRQDSTHPGQFLPAVVIPGAPIPPPFTGGIALGDLNHDSLVDVASWNGSMIQIALQSKSTPGTFMAGPVISAAGTGGGALAEPLVAADFTGDGLVDLAIIPQNTVEVFPQLTTGGFGSGMPAGPAAATSLATGLIDGDPRADLVVTTTTSTSSVLLQNSAPSGTFTSVELAGTPFGKFGVAVDDADADGRPDLVIDGVVFRQCAAPAQQGHAFAPGETVGVGNMMTRFLPVADPGNARPDLIYYDPANESVIVVPQE